MRSNFADPRSPIRSVARALPREHSPQGHGDCTRGPLKPLHERGLTRRAGRDERGRYSPARDDAANSSFSAGRDDTGRPPAPTAAHPGFVRPQGRTGGQLKHRDHWSKRPVAARMQEFPCRRRRGQPTPPGRTIRPVRLSMAGACSRHPPPRFGRQSGRGRAVSRHPSLSVTSGRRPVATRRARTSDPCPRAGATS